MLHAENFHYINESLNKNMSDITSSVYLNTYLYLFELSSSNLFYLLVTLFLVFNNTVIQKACVCVSMCVLYYIILCYTQVIYVNGLYIILNCIIVRNVLNI